MNIETVNELIASLESAGELSIREQKFLKLAKEFRICSASLDAAIKTGNMLADQNAQLAAENAYLVPKAASELSNAWVLHKYLIGIQAAIMYLDNGNKKAAQEWLYGTIAGPGFEFPDGVEDIDAWATHQMRGSISHPQAIEIIKAETPATDAFLAEVRASGVEMAVDVVKQCYDNICAGGLQENREYEESIVQPHLDGIDDELKEIIAQLRKGVQS